MTRNPLPEQERIERARVGAALRALRKDRGISQEELATAISKSRPYIANIEAGRKPLPYALLVQIAATLEVDRRDIAHNWDAVA